MTCAAHVQGASLGIPIADIRVGDIMESSSGARLHSRRLFCTRTRATSALAHRDFPRADLR